MRTYSKITVAIAAMALSLAAGCTTNDTGTTTPVSPVGAAANQGSPAVTNVRNQGESWTAEGVDYVVTWTSKPASVNVLKDYGKSLPYMEVTVSVNNHGAQVLTSPNSRLGVSVSVNGELTNMEMYAPADTGTDVLPGNKGVFTTTRADVHGNVQIQVATATRMDTCYWIGTV